MGNKPVKKVPVNKEHFMKVVNECGSSIKQLGRAYSEIERDERSIRRCLSNGEMPPQLLESIARYLNVHPDYLSGKRLNRLNGIRDEKMRQYFLSFITASRNPYILKAHEDVDLPKLLSSLLSINDISIEQFHTLHPQKRVLFWQKVFLEITRVFSLYFTSDSLGKDLGEIVQYMEAMVDDFDPTSDFAFIEGVGLSEEDMYVTPDENE